MMRPTSGRIMLSRDNTIEMKGQELKNRTFHYYLKNSFKM